MFHTNTLSYSAAHEHEIDKRNSKLIFETRNKRETFLKNLQLTERREKREHDRQMIVDDEKVEVALLQLRDLKDKEVRFLYIFCRCGCRRFESFVHTTHRIVSLSISNSSLK